jgi:hypothetical protein
MKLFNTENKMERFVCGMQLKTIVSGFGKFSIKNLDLYMRRVGGGVVFVMSQVVSYSLTSLVLRFGRGGGSYEVLGAFFSSYLLIRSIKLVFFDFGEDPISLTPTMGSVD